MATMDDVAVEARVLSLRYRGALRNLADKLNNGTCLIFLGAGAAVDSASPDLPTGEELSKELAIEVELEWHHYVPLSTIAFYYEFFNTRDTLNKYLVRKLTDSNIQPSRTIRKLVEIVKFLEDRHQKVFIITTNYDQQFEAAYRSQMGRDPHVVIYRGAEDPNRKDAKLHVGLENPEYPEYWRATETATYLYKMHGCISDAKGHGLVITEEDYINFLANAQHEDPRRRLPVEVRGKIALSTVLFVGYSLADWNFRVIFKATAERDHADQQPSYAVQYFSPPEDPTKREREEERWEASVEFWRDKKVTVLNRDAYEFMSDLRRYLEAAPQGSPSAR